jgi:steroid 5-alpha reductase family enzyme
VTLGGLWGLSALVVVAGAVLLWGVSLGRRDASIIDAWWGPFFVAIAAVGALFGAGAPARRGLLLVLVATWGARLGLHIHRRNRRQPEDYRYRAMRARWGERFGAVSLVTVFLLQAGLALLIAAPLVAAASAPEPAGLGGLDVAGVALWLVGFLFEAVGDAQLARFKRDPAHRGQVMDRGLWRFTRHPNYFGDATLWWGYWLIAASAPDARWSAVGPLVMTLLLVKVSGVALLERGLAASKPGYADYVARTSAFFPWPPRRPPAAVS